LSCQGKRVDAIFIIVMTSNSPTGVRPGRGDTKWKYHITDENIQKREENVVQTVPRIVLSVQNGKAHPRKIGLLEIMLERLMTRLTRNASVTLRYYADATCTSCGVCERICPSGRITMEDGRPAWNAAIKCYYCYACFNYCPHQSILLPNYTEKNGRYHHPAVSAADIASQKDMPC
ncbi:MAG: EFR1 family ferrodoxin, partial [Spirochaetota bacterium]